VAVTRWEPATEAEAALRDALLVNDQEMYFRILSRLQLFLPVSADSLAGRAPMGWGTWSTGGRTHVLAFTSPEAMRICLGGSAASAREMRYTELAAVWPSAEWWLAVNPGLPIEGYLPAWFVAQLARGDSRLPGREPVSPAPVQSSSVPAPGDARVPPTGRTPQPPPVRARATVPAPAPRPYVPERPAGGAPGEEGVRDPRSSEVAAQLSPAPPQEAGRAYQTASVSPGIAGAMPGRQESPPPNAGEGPNGLPRRPVPHPAPPDVGAEASVATAVRQPAQRRDGLPAGSSAPAAPDAERRDPLSPAEPNPRADPTLRVDPGPMESTMRVDPGRADATVRVDPGQMQSTMPVGYARTESTMRIDPGQMQSTMPIGPARTESTMRVDPGRMESTMRVDPGRMDATGRIAPPAPTEPASPDFTPANDVESSLLAAAGTGSTDSFLSTLLLATVVLPVAPPSAPGARPGDPGFVWRTESLDGEPYLVVFTSQARLVEHLGSLTDTVSVRFVQLIRRWPDREWSFAVNPGTPVGAKLPGPEIVALANWAAEVGLGDDDEEPAPPADDGNQPAGQVSETAAQPQPARPTMMQKVVPPGQVGYYLERGYDRVSGFVHRATEVGHLTTPSALFAALGLAHPNAPFSPNAAEVYVLRWPVHRPGLYRIPYGGQSESAMRAMQGWVIERPPFRGNGFAPGESGEVIAEFKVDSVRLPHGAQLWRLAADGAETLVATLDSDVPRWRRVGEA
jgi:SseB protein N-terminal domain